MAKGAMLSVKRGKLGDAVGYNVSNSNTKERQGWRIYQPVVKNPQTDAQMVQRVKLAAVNNQYRALKEVIRRGFEGQEYGDPSRRAWLKMALGQDFDGPWLPKGSQVPVPVKSVPLTVGSLPPIVIGNEETDFSVSSFTMPSDDAPTTIAEVSELFIGWGYKPGDQVTIIQGWVPIRLAFAWQVFSFYIDAQDGRTLSTLGLYANTDGDGSDIHLVLRLNQPVSALAIAVSRDGDGVHLRSTSYIGTSVNDVDAVWYGSQMYELAKRSYMKTQAESTDWPIQPNRAGGSTYVTKAADGTSVTLVSTSMTNGYVVVVSDTGEEYYVKCTDVKLTPYNAWLKAKSGTQAEMYTATAPVDPVPSDSYVPLNPTSNPTEENLALWYFLLSQGFDALSLMGRA